MAITIATSVIISCILLIAVGVWLASSSHVMFAEVVHSISDFANQQLLAYGLSSSKRAPEAIHPHRLPSRLLLSLLSAYFRPTPAMSMSSTTGDSTRVTVPANVPSVPAPDQAILEYSPFPELPVLCPQIIDPALQPQQPSDPPQISPDPDLNLQTNQTLDSARPLQVYSRRKAPPPTSEPVQSWPSESQDVEALLAYGLSISRRAPDAIHPYGYSKERFVWSLISAVRIFCLGSCATVLHGFQNLWTTQPPDNMKFAALVIGGSFAIEGSSLFVAIKAIKEVAAIFLIQRNRHALLSRAMDDHDMEKVLHFLKNDPVVDALYDCKSKVIGPGFFRFKAEIDFNGEMVVRNYIQRTGREEWARQSGRSRDRIYCSINNDSLHSLSDQDSRAFLLEDMGDKQDSGKTTSSANEGAHPLHSSDHPGVSLVNNPLVGSNYLSWSTTIRTSLEAKDKISFIDGSLLPPEDSAEFKKWKTVDSMIKSWIVNSTSKELAENFIYCQTSKALWDVLEERFGVSNSPQLYEIQRRTSTIEQGGDSIMTYYTKINKCWDEMGRLLPIPECTCGKCTCGLHKRITEIDASIKLLQFLMGINPVYDVIRSQILNLDPLPSVNKAYSMVMRVEKQRQINMGILNGNENVVALMTNAYQGKNERDKGGFNKKKEQSKRDKYCEHCRTTGHTKDTCFKIHGYPDWFKELREKRAASGKKQAVNACGDLTTETTNDAESSTKKDLANMVSYLLKEVQRMGKTKAPATNDEQSNFADLHDFAGTVQPLNCKIVNNRNWIIDTGATTHMCSNLELMKDTRILPHPRIVHLPDKTIKEDQRSKKSLAKGAAYGKLYYLTAASFSRNFRNKFEGCTSTTNFTCNVANATDAKTINSIKTWHSRLPFPNSDSRAKNKLELLHMDLWGPYRYPTLNSAHYFLTIVDDNTRATWVFLLRQKSQFPYHTLHEEQSIPLPNIPISINEDDDKDLYPIEPAEDPLDNTRETTRTRRAPSWLADYVCACKTTEKLNPSQLPYAPTATYSAFFAEVNKTSEPYTYTQAAKSKEWFDEVAAQKDQTGQLKFLSDYGTEIVTALGSEVDRLEKEIQVLVPGIRHVDIEAHNPTDG
ncbi:metal tolerance protein C4 isoform X2 [Senna tora]|uniref:Metal tolerance protein C4 isoform X2 n=1 Tax=Senna tora TaxID=362788 RepID=A0A834TCN5_9FABA|nr:metal tolerance protein C4 isoform X2 [Senna tora]